MTEDDKILMKDRIAALIKKFEAEIIETEKMTQPIKPENSLGRVSRMDAINNKGVMEAALRNKKSKLNSLKKALDNIDNADFGVCERCERTIKAERMMFMPESTKCVNCAR